MSSHVSRACCRTRRHRGMQEPSSQTLRRTKCGAFPSSLTCASWTSLAAGTPSAAVSWLHGRPASPQWKQLCGARQRQASWQSARRCRKALRRRCTRALNDELPPSDMPLGGWTHQAILAGFNAAGRGGAHLAILHNRRIFRPSGGLCKCITPVGMKLLSLHTSLPWARDKQWSTPNEFKADANPVKPGHPRVTALGQLIWLRRAAATAPTAWCAAQAAHKSLWPHACTCSRPAP